MDRRNVDLKRAESQTQRIEALRIEALRIEALRAELEGREQDRPAFTKPFVAHGGKPPAPPARD